MSESTQKCSSCSETVPLEYSVCPFCGFGLLEYELKKFSFKPKLKEVFIRIYSFFRRPFKTSEEFGVATESKGTNILLLLFSLFLSLRYYMVILKANLNYSVTIIIGNPEAFHISLSMGLILFLVTLLLMPFIIWIIYKLFFNIGTWLMSKFANMLGSETTKKQYQTIAGYAIAPIVIGEFLGILFTLIGRSGSLGNAGGVSFNDFASYVTTLYNSPVMLVFKILMIILWVVMIIYTTIGLRVVGKMNWISAAISTTLPIAVFVYFFYFLNLFG
ncbi:MAG: hypothetical protein KGD64_00850 [Candidatus Heimdallarchaeota archaeon]|nr:hypothetical protein [Candidatus Heimdallarchaeota archaeon]